MYLRFWTERQLCRLRLLVTEQLSRLRPHGTRQGGRRVAPKQARVVDHGVKRHTWPRIELSDRGVVIAIMGLALTSIGLVALLVSPSSVFPATGRAEPPQALKQHGARGSRSGASNPASPGAQTPSTVDAAQPVSPGDPGGVTGQTAGQAAGPTTASVPAPRAAAIGAGQANGSSSTGTTGGSTTSSATGTVPALPGPLPVTAAPVVPDTTAPVPAVPPVVPSVTCKPRGKSGLPPKCKPVGSADNDLVTAP